MNRRGAVKVGEIAVRRVPLDGANPCSVVDAEFRAHPDFTSVLVSIGDDVVLIGRDEFYQTMAGRLGFGWALHSQRSVGSIFDSPALVWAHDTDVLELGLALIDRGVDHSSRDLVVRADDGSFLTASVVDVLRAVGRAVGAQASQLQANERRMRALIQANADPILLMDTSGYLQMVSPAYAALIGEPTDGVDALAGRRFADMVAESDVQLWHDAVDQALSAKGQQQKVELRVVRRSGEARWVVVALRSMVADPSVGGLVLNVRDITEARQLREGLEHQAERDALTGLMNRRTYIRHLEAALGDVGLVPGATERLIGVVYLDLDGFKGVNDTLGHLAGDELLIQIGHRLEDALRGGDVIARLGGDEFAALIRAENQASVEAAANRMREAVRLPVEVGQDLVTIRASVGIATAEVASHTAEELMRRADISMYSAKRSGRDAAQVWTPEVDATHGLALRTADDLASALDRDEFWLAFQPQVDMQTGQICGLEALLRWEHPKLGNITPADLIPLAEQRGLIFDIGQWVLRTTCRSAARWISDAMLAPDAVVGVNASARELGDERYVGCITQILADTGLAPANLTIEITETDVVADVAVAANTLRSLREMGVKVAIDDFGTGYASLTYLREFAVDSLKIDRSFVRDLGLAERSDLIIDGIVMLADALGIGILAEGVEADNQVQYLLRLGVTKAQGYLFGRPMPEAQFEERLRAGIVAPCVDSSPSSF